MKHYLRIDENNRVILLLKENDKNLKETDILFDEIEDEKKEPHVLGYENKDLIQNGSFLIEYKNGYTSLRDRNVVEKEALIEKINRMQKALDDIALGGI